MEDPVEGSSVAGDASVWWHRRRVRLSVCARINATPHLCPCAAPMAGSMRTTAKCIAPRATRRKEYTLFTARIASSKVRLSVTLKRRLLLVFLLWCSWPSKWLEKKCIAFSLSHTIINRLQFVDCGRLLLISFGFSPLRRNDLLVYLLANYNYLLRSCLPLLMASIECWAPTVF